MRIAATLYGGGEIEGQSGLKISNYRGMCDLFALRGTANNAQKTTVSFTSHFVPE